MGSKIKKYSLIVFLLRADEYVIIKHMTSETPDVFRYDDGELQESQTAPLNANSPYGAYYTDDESVSFIRKWSA